MKKLFCVVGCLVMLSSVPVMAQGDKPSVVVVRTSQANLKFIITTARGGEKPEKQELKFSSQDYYDQVTVKLQQLIASYLEQGYVLQSMTTMDPSYPSNMFVFVKAPKP